MTKEWPLEGMTKTGERISIKPHITSRDVKVLSREPYSSVTTSGLRMSVEVTRAEPHAKPPLDIRAVTTGRIERTKTAAGYRVRHQHETKFFRPANSTEPVAITRDTATLDCTEGITPSPAYAAFIWDRYEIKVGSGQPMTVLGTMLRDRTLDISIERLVESHWDSGDNPVSGFHTFMDHVISNSENYDIMRADDAALSEDWW